MKDEITSRTREFVKRRSLEFCEAITDDCTYKAEEIHHIKLRRFGDHTPKNLLHVCKACHIYIHNNPSKSYERGWLKHSWEES